MSRLFAEADMGNWRTEWGKCVEWGWECEELNENAGAGNQRGNARNLGRNAKNAESQGGASANQGGGLSIAVETTYNIE